VNKVCGNLEVETWEAPIDIGRVCCITQSIMVHGIVLLRDLGLRLWSASGLLAALAMWSWAFTLEPRILNQPPSQAHNPVFVILMLRCIDEI
jgi:hypothetical protein